MKFIACQEVTTGGALKEFKWLYIATCKVAVDDIIQAPWGYGPEHRKFFKVTAVGNTKASVGSNYNGAIKLIDRVVDDAEAAALKRIHKAQISLGRAQSAWFDLQDRKQDERRRQEEADIAKRAKVVKVRRYEEYGAGDYGRY